MGAFECEVDERSGPANPFGGLPGALGPLVDAGLAVHWLHPREKRPIGNLWSTAPVQSIADLTTSYKPGNNVGVRLGEPSKVAGHYLHVIDLDIRVTSLAAEAKAALAKFVPEFDTLPFVVSGSAGESRHYYFLTGRPFASRKLAHSAEKITDVKGKQHWSWEVEVFGTGKQVAMPPSIHPDTGKPYVWGREIDFDDLDLGVGPFVGEARVETWAPAAVAPIDDEDDDGFGTQVRAAPMGLTQAEIDKCLAALPLADYCEDRDGWLTVGMALHHEFEGKAAGLQVWNAFSKQSPKFDERDQARVWKSFESSRRPTRMATLIKAAAAARFAADDNYGDDVDFDADEDEEDGPQVAKSGESDDMDDLLGDAPVASSDDIDWSTLLDLNEEGAIKPTLHNIGLIVRHDARTAGLPAFNLFTQEVMLRGTPGKASLKGRNRAKRTKQLTSPIWTVKDPVNGDLWKDRHDHSVRDLFEAPRSQGGYGIKVSDRDLRAALSNVASENCFHPVREYLSGLAWDGVPRLESLFTRYLGADDSAYTRSISRLTLLGAVVRAFEPGHKFDFVAIFEGLQGKRKSTFISILARHWFTEIEGDFDDRKQMVEKMQGSWILELPELQGFGKHEIQTIKAFVSAQVDKVRLAYAHRAVDYERQCIFIGSTNDSKYLRDPTGGRRFWPVLCTVDEIDTVVFEAEVDQVWAEAVVVYREMRDAHPRGTLPLYITDEAAKAEAIEMQEDRRVLSLDDEMAGNIAEWLEKPISDPSGFDDEDDEMLGVEPILRDVVCGMAVWCEMLGRDMSSYGQAQQQLFGRALPLVPGWRVAPTVKIPKYGRQRVYRRIGAPIV